jgi:exopolysaccharide biosynthesis polyprenyl glycosylphosphotransferase
MPNQDAPGTVITDVQSSPAALTPSNENTESNGVAVQRLSNLRQAAQHEWIPALLILLLDVVFWTGIYAAANGLRATETIDTLQFVILGALDLFVIVQALYIIGGYDRHIEMRSLFYATEHLLALATAAMFSALLIYSIASYEQPMKPSRGVLLLSFAVFAPVSLMYRRWIRASIAADTASKSFLVLGSGEAATSFYHAYKNSVNQQRLYFVDLNNENVGRPIAGEGSLLIEGDVEAKLANADNNYSGIILAEKIKKLSPELLDQLVRTQFHATRVYTLESFYETHWRYVPLNVIDPVWPLQTGFQLASISPYHYLKRLFDVTVAGTLLVICSPLLGLIACIVWLTNGRPAIFRQERVGREDRPFTAYKFRTMRDPEVRGQRSEVGKHEQERSEEDIYTRKDDPRITRVGRWLRKLRLDELPQLWNVLKGDMSLIGPRAEWIKCAEQYEKKIPFYHFRHLVKPGITGWAQVNYPYGESEEDAIEKLKYDLYYIRHYSLKLDAMIALKTIHTMLFARGR